VEPVVVEEMVGEMEVIMAEEMVGEMVEVIHVVMVFAIMVRPVLPVQQIAVSVEIVGGTVVMVFAIMVRPVLPVQQIAVSVEFHVTLQTVLNQVINVGSPQMVVVVI
jgi:hypothetical protein